MRQRFCIAVAIFFFVAPAFAAKKKPAAAPPSITVDTHADTPTEWMAHPFDLGVVNTRGHFDYPRMKAGGLDAEFFAAYVPAKYANKGAAAFCMKIMEAIHEMVDGYPTWVRFATSTTDIRNAVRDGRRAILIGIEGGHAIEDSLELLRAFYRFGARYMTLTHTNSNNWADSSGDEAKHNGLTAFGKDVVLEMNRLGMLVDISHVADKTFWDTIETTKAPVIASHSSARARTNAPRTMPDETLAAVGKNGGVVQVNFYSAFVDEDYRKAAAAQDKAAEAAEEKAAVEKWKSEHPGKDVPY